MRLLIGLTLLGALTACARHRDETPDTVFWRWFVEHKHEVATVKRADEQIADQLAVELHKIDPQLTFEVGVARADREFIVSADGIKSAFPTVKRLVAAAPPIPGWKIIAFRPRKSADFSIELGDGTRVTSNQIRFRVLRAGSGKVDLELFVEGMTELTTAVKQAIFLQLDSVLGEYDVETYVGGLDVRPAAADGEGTRPLRELPAVVDALK